MPRSRSVTRTETRAPDAASSSSAFSVEVNDRRPTAARLGSRLLLRRDPRSDSAVPFGLRGHAHERVPSDGVGSEDVRRRGARGTSDGAVFSCGSDAVGRARRVHGPAARDHQIVTRLSCVEPERVRLGDVECIVERVDVADDLVAAELVRRVRVDRQQADGLGIPALLLPDLRPATAAGAARRCSRRSTGASTGSPSGVGAAARARTP